MSFTDIDHILDTAHRPRDEDQAAAALAHLERCGQSDLAEMLGLL